MFKIERKSGSSLIIIYVKYYIFIKLNKLNLYVNNINVENVWHRHNKYKLYIDV